MTYPNCPNNCPPLRENKEKKFKKPKKSFVCFFQGPYKFVENRQLNRKDFKIYKRSIICYEIQFQLTRGPIFHTPMKLFLRKLGDIWSLGLPTLLKVGNFTPFYKRLNKKCCHNGILCLNPYVFTEYSRFFPKKVLVNVLTLLKIIIFTYFQHFWDFTFS